ncbi:uncharacterized protein M437DRAFT_70579 [Aureobasidium melanogenum CBS 110374]|uniref:Uncharacterized protein n=2 Tax=Aureobasidium melanogenum TaxID=46634 RepID=A0A074VBK1_AURM1|nr:uncharacterized protein M437DRAFT_70579 [Aureobasidium melanogenum CBS 110374]KEQ57708.1 hypothetical protein M437DRAFT_70579 [Aureobasidium melanogenum CBS 110374]
MDAASEVSQFDMTVENLDQTTAEQMGDPSNGLGQDTSGSSVQSSRNRARSPRRPGVDEGGHGSNGSREASFSSSHLAHSSPGRPHTNMFEKARACLRSIENNGSKIQRKAEVQVEAQQSIVNDTQDRSVERCSIDDDQVTQLNTKVDKILSSAITSCDMKNLEDKIYNIMEDMIDGVLDEIKIMRDTMHSMKDTIESNELESNAIFKLLDRLTALFLGAAECPEDRIPIPEKHLRLTAEARDDGLSDLGGEITYHGSSRTSPSPPKRSQISAVRRRLSLRCCFCIPKTRYRDV